MAFWVLSGGGPPDVPDTLPQHHSQQHRQTYHHYPQNDEIPYVNRPKRTVEYHRHGDAAYDSDGAMKRARVDDWTQYQVPSRDHGQLRHSYQHDGQAGPVKNLAFYVIREGSHSTPPEHIYNRPPAIPSAPTANFTSTSMERTASGLSISSDPSIYTPIEPNPESYLSDLEAASIVLKNIASSHHNSQPSRILHSLVHPSSGPNYPEFTLDNDALTSIFHAANGLFFGSRLSKRVTWDWTSEEDGNPQYDAQIIGTTALRRCEQLGGYETLIVLSSPILKDTRYNRRLLIATFLHEMIHSYLFITCGMKAGAQGGHTEGFRRIAEGIDEWVGGRVVLRLGEVEADLGRFCQKEHHPHGKLEEYNGRPGYLQWYEQEVFGGRRWNDVYTR